MTYIVVTDNLIDNLDNLDIDEFKYEKIKSNEFMSNTNVSLFSDDLYKFVTDEFFTSVSYTHLTLPTSHCV